ncbi:MAG: hypothetical protein DMG53_05390 [Acidobacteria bacterium]|nr:MAG: hypothetical protein DMG53_05390 [Acidobacteriota bacterium]
MPLAELIFVLFALLALATPFITLVLLGKYKKLRENLDQLREENSRQHVSFQREVADLQRQLLAAVHPAAPAVGQPTQPPAAPATSAKKETPVPAAHVDLPAPLTLPAPVLFPMPEKKPEAQPLPKPQEPAPIAPAPVPIAPASTPAQKLPAPPAPVEPKPVLPAVAKTSAEVKPAARVAPQGTPPSLTSPQPPAPRTPAPTPRAPAGIPPATAARVSAPPPVSAYRAPAPRPTFQQRMKTVSAIEEALGTNWLPKIGIIMTVIGFALLGIYELGALGAPGKVGISYFASAVLLGGGIFLEKNERYRLLGRTSIGGGWALLFFSTFGIYHVQAMRVLPVSVGSLTLDCVLMLIVAVAMALHTLRYRSQFVTGLAFLLGYTTVALSQDTVYSLSAGVFLAIGLVSIVLKMGWFELEVFGILSSYLNHLYWLYRLLGIEGAHGRHFEEYRASLALLFFYWLTFRISYIARNIKTDFEEHISTLAALLNVLLLLGVMKFQSVQPELAYLALLVVGALEFSLAQLPITKRRRQAFVVLSVVGATLMLAAVPFHYSGNNVAILWLVGAEAFLAAGIIAKEVVFRHLGLLTGLLVGLHLLGLDFRHLLNLRLANEDPALAAGVLFSLCAVVFYINSLGVGSRWKDLFDGSSGRPLLTIHSYLGAFAAASAAWALFSHDWTALAFGAIMLILAALGRVLESPNLQVQYALLGLLTFCRAMVVNLHLESPEHAHVRLRLLTFPILGAAFYLTARLAALRDEPGQRTIRGLFAAAGSGCFVLLIWFEAPELWQPLACMVFAVALSEAARALRYHALPGTPIFSPASPYSPRSPLIQAPSASGTPFRCALSAHCLSLLAAIGSPSGWAHRMNGISSLRAWPTLGPAPASWSGSFRRRFARPGLPLAGSFSPSCSRCPRAGFVTSSLPGRPTSSVSALWSALSSTTTNSSKSSGAPFPCASSPFPSLPRACTSSRRKPRLRSAMPAPSPSFILSRRPGSWPSSPGTKLPTAGWPPCGPHLRWSLQLSISASSSMNCLGNRTLSPD